MIISAAAAARVCVLCGIMIDFYFSLMCLLRFDTPREIINCAGAY
jgi:hypothetical protein